MVKQRPGNAIAWRRTIGIDDERSFGEAEVLFAISDMPLTGAQCRAIHSLIEKTAYEMDGIINHADIYAPGDN